MQPSNFLWVKVRVENWDDSTEDAKVNNENKLLDAVADLHPVEWSYTQLRARTKKIRLNEVNSSSKAN